MLISPIYSIVDDISVPLVKSFSCIRTDIRCVLCTARCIEEKVAPSAVQNGGESYNNKNAIFHNL